MGIVTARDNLTIKWTPEEAWHTVLNFSKLDAEVARLAYDLGKDVRDWKVKLAQKDLLDSGLDKKKLVPILYRPFDLRYTYYTGKSRGFICMPRPEVMRHMMDENLGLIFHKREELLIPYSHFLVTTEIIEHGCLSSKTTCYLAPLYLKNEKKDLFKHKKEGSKRKPNLNEVIAETLSKIYSKQLSPEEIFYYIYAVLYSNIYRTKYAEFLKIDFPRVPFTEDYQVFGKMSELGKKLVDLHLLKSPELDTPIARFQGKGGDKVEKVKYESKRVYINGDQYFEGVQEEVWEYQIGGYQVCEKWLKDRKGRKLSLDDIKHYCKVVTVIQKTIEVQKEIDNIYPEVEKNAITVEK